MKIIKVFIIGLTYFLTSLNMYGQFNVDNFSNDEELKEVYDFMRLISSDDLNDISDVIKSSKFLKDAYSLLKDSKSYDEINIFIGGASKLIDDKVSQLIVNITDTYLLDEAIEYTSNKLELCMNEECNINMLERLKVLELRKEALESSNCRNGNIRRLNQKDIKFSDLMEFYHFYGYHEYDERAYEMNVPTIFSLISEFKSLFSSDYIRNPLILELIEDYANVLACCGEEMSTRVAGNNSYLCKRVNRKVNEISKFFIQEKKRRKDAIWSEI